MIKLKLTVPPVVLRPDIPTVNAVTPQGSPRDVNVKSGWGGGNVGSLPPHPTHSDLLPVVTLLVLSRLPPCGAYHALWLCERDSWSSVIGIDMINNRIILACKFVKASLTESTQ